MTCEPCREQILPYLYDLLDPLEREQLGAHVQHCPSCQDALKAAQDQVGMLAEAVQPVKTDIVFKAPVQTSLAPTVALQRPPRRMLFLNRWALAASILFLLFTAGTVVGWTFWRENSTSLSDARGRLAKARLELSKSQEELREKRNQNQQEIRAIQKEIDAVFDQWKKEENNTRKKFENERVQIIITGPRAPLAGARNSYGVEFRNNDLNFAQKNQPEKIQRLPGNLPPMQARVVDQKTRKVIHEQQLKIQGNNRANFDLPSDLPIGPADDLALEFETKNAEGKVVNLRDNLKLVFPEYVTHLATDRPMYRPGETVRFRSLTLERFSLKPPEQEFHLRYRIVGPRGEEVDKTEVASQVVAGKDKIALKGPMGQPLRGLGAGEFVLPADLAEGWYTLTVGEVNDRFNEEKRAFQVRRWQTPRFNKDVSFHRTSYGPGDQVKFTVTASPVQAQAPAFRNVQITATVKVDDQQIHHDGGRHVFSDKDARMEFTVTLPGNLTWGVGTVTIVCNDGAGNHDTTVRSLPIVLRDLQVDFYPEGGDLIAGVPNRVYFQARTPANKAADFTGVVVDQFQKEVARIQTLTDEREPGINQGLGSFTFTPQLDSRYTLRFESPIGIDKRVALPAVKATGVVLHAQEGVVEKELNLLVHSVGKPRELLIGAYCRGRMLDHKFLKAPANQPIPITLKPQAQVGGVYRVTVFEKIHDQGNAYYQPLAERLVYRKNQSHVDVSITSDRKSYQPGDTVELRFQAQNEKREFVPAIAMVAVVDASVRRLVDDKTERAMPTHFLLTTEVRNPEDLENADVLLGDHPKSALALDLLLGSQGWRRFAEQDPKMFAQRNQHARAPVFLANSTKVPQFLDAEQKQIDKLDEAFVVQAIALNKRLAEKEKTENGPPELQKNVEVIQMEIQLSQNQVDMANQRLREIRGFMVQFLLGGTLLTFLFLGFFLISVGLRRLSAGGNAALWLVLGVALLGLLFLISVIGTFAFMGEPVFFGDFRFDMDRRLFNAVGQKIGVPAGNEEGDPGEALPLLPEEILLAELPGELPRVPAKRRFGPEGGVNERRLPPVEQRIWVNAQDFVPLEVEDRRLREQGNYLAILQRKLDRRVNLPPVHDPSIVREYAHQHQAQKDGVRRDFTETVYWHPVLVMPDGAGQVKFDLSDSVTRYGVTVLSNTLDGRLGFNLAEITAKLPFTVESKVPIEVTENDQIAIPVAVTNEMPREISAQLSARGRGLTFDGGVDRTLALKANETRREIFRVKPALKEGEATFRIGGKVPGKGDASDRKFTIVRDGFPVTGSIGGVLEFGPAEHTINLPEQWLPGSLQVRAHFYPSPLAELQQGLEAMLREPVGCFEQSSSSNYPNVLVLRYLKETNQANPFAEMRARQLLQSGCQKLTAFECSEQGVKRGYEWFGAAPAHEALTAYGLLLFRDMAKVHPVDPAMLERTEKYLLDQRDSKGGFLRNPKGLDQFGRAPDAVTNAYILWALTESGVAEKLDVELKALHAASKTSKDPYFLALVGLSHLNHRQPQAGLEILRKVAALQKADGQVAGGKTSITGSQGRDLAVETTALALLGWLKSERPQEFNANTQVAVKWLAQQRRGTGGYGGTQATILALKAMVLHAQKFPRFTQAGEVQLFHRRDFAGVPGNKIAFRDDGQPESRISFTARSQDPITVTLRNPDALNPGNNVLQLNVTGNNTMPYTLTWSYRTLKPPSDAQAPIKIATKLSSDQVQEGETVKLKATVENVSGKGQGMTVAIVGLPGGLAIPEAAQQIKALARMQDGNPGTIAAWELRGRELVLYWRDFAPKAKVEIDLDLICRLPGVYRGPASRAYLYYDADRKYWTEPLNVRIAEAK